MRRGHRAGDLNVSGGSTPVNKLPLPPVEDSSDTALNQVQVNEVCFSHCGIFPLTVFIADHIAGHNVREKHHLRFEVIQLGRWREVESDDSQELSKERFHDKIFW